MDGVKKPPLPFNIPNKNHEYSPSYILILKGFVTKNWSCDGVYQRNKKEIV